VDIRTGMSDSGAGFGGFLIGLGAGWYLFRFLDFSFDIFAYILILMGAGMIINALLSREGRKSPLQGLFGGIIGGLILALFLTQGFGIIGDIFSEFRDFDGTNYRATDTEILSGDIDLDKLYLEVDDKNGAITVEKWDRDGYRIDLTLRAKGSTDTHAQQRLQEIDVLFSDSLDGGTQTLELGFDIPGNQWNNYAVTVEVKLPENVELELNLDTSNGRITLQDIIASRITLDTSNGDIELNDVYSDILTGSTSNGKIQGQIEGNNIELRTSNGSIDLTLTGTSSGKYELSTSNGSIDLTVPKDSNIGYSVDLRTSIGRLDLNLDDLDYSINENRHKVAETDNFDSMQTQITIEAETSLGSIEIN
jgi:DUF4097 and DUF4098 domain-containing protein YvlB